MPPWGQESKMECGMSGWQLWGRLSLGFQASTRDKGQLLETCLQKLEQLPKVSHRFHSSVGCLWAHGCGFHNHVGAPGFGKTCLLSSEQGSTSDFCWQLSSHVRCHSLSSLLPMLGFPCFPSPLSFPCSPLTCSPEGSRGNKMTILSAVTDDFPF